MALSTQDQAASYPLAAYNFRVTVGGTTMRFAKVSGLVREHQTLTYRDGLSFLDGEQIVKYFVDKYVTVTLEQGVVASEKDLRQWLESAEKSAVEVQLCDASGAAVLAWRINKAIPVKLTAPTFDAKTNEVALDSLEIKAAGISIVELG